jgi:hypothetical protein
MLANPLPQMTLSNPSADRDYKNKNSNAGFEQRPTGNGSRLNQATKGSYTTPHFVKGGEGGFDGQCTNVMWFGLAEKRTLWADCSKPLLGQRLL